MSHDVPTLPAHLIFNSLNQNTKVAQTSFQDVGSNNLNLSDAFPKIRNNTKVYNTHLLHTLGPSFSKSYELSSMNNLSISEVSTLDYKINRISNLINPITSLALTQNFDNSKGFNEFLQHSPKGGFVDKPVNTSNSDVTTRLSRDLSTFTQLSTTPALADLTDKILQSDQSIQQQKFINPNYFNLNLQEISLGKNYTPLTLTLKTPSQANTSGVDKPYEEYSSTLTNRVFGSKSFTPVLSSDITLASSPKTLYEGTQSNYQTSLGGVSANTKESLVLNSLIDANFGSLDKIPTPLQKLY